VTGGGFNNREVPPLIQKLTSPTAHIWQTFQSEAVESTSTSSFKMEQAPEVTDCILAESTEVLGSLSHNSVIHTGFRKGTIRTASEKYFYTDPKGK
jgi:hypothetical protein